MRCSSKKLGLVVLDVVDVDGGVLESREQRSRIRVQFLGDEARSLARSR